MGGWSLGLLLGSVGCFAATATYLFLLLGDKALLLGFFLSVAISVFIMSVWRLSNRDPADDLVHLITSVMLSAISVCWLIGNYVQNYSLPIPKPSAPASSAAFASVVPDTKNVQV